MSDHVHPSAKNPSNGYSNANKQFRTSLRVRERARAYQAAHRDERAAYLRNYYQDNRQRLLAQKREYYLRTKAQRRAYYEANRPRIREYDRRRNQQRREVDRPRKKEYQARYRSGAAAKLAHNLRNRLAKFIRRSGRSESTEELLGCSFTEFASFIEAQFLPRMSWRNYGRAWHIDHVIPCRAFDLTNPQQRKLCFHHTNLRPLWAKQNLRKQGKVVDPQLRLLLPLA